MRRMSIRWATMLIFMAATVAAAQNPAAQTPTSQGPQAPANQTPKIQNPGNPAQPKAPDMVCFGHGPEWSIQFINGEARYISVNEPDHYFLGDFYWVPDEKVWAWHRADDLGRMNGAYALSATVQKSACTDPVKKKTFPYSAQVNLPQGDMASGCCRKLRPGEAAVGKHGYQPTTPPPQ